MKLSAILKHREKNFEWRRQACICPLVDHRQQPIKNASLTWVIIYLLPNEIMSWRLLSRVELGGE